MKSTKKLCLGGILIALIVVLSSYCQVPLGASIRLDIGYAVVTFAAMYMGPVFGFFIALFSRIINDLVFSGSISFWWAIGSAFFGLAIGFVYPIIAKIHNGIVKTIILAIVVTIISFVSFSGIVPIVASWVGLEYGFMLGIGVLASIADAIVALVLGYPVYKAICRITKTEHM